MVFINRILNLGRRRIVEKFYFPHVCDRQWFSFGGEQREDPTAALGRFYGEQFELPVEKKVSNELKNTRECTTKSSTDNVLEMLRSECDAEISVYTSKCSGKPATQLVLQLGTNRERKSLAETLIKRYRKLGVPVGCEGLGAKDADWIVLDLHTCMIHIFDPQVRIDYSFDEHLQQEAQENDAESNQDDFLQQFAASIPRHLQRL